MEHNTYTIRHATTQDLTEILAVYQAARVFMAENGNPTQWGNNRPSREQVAEDIRQEKSYVCTENGNIVGVFFFSTDGEPLYDTIEGSGWPDHGSYGVVHRIATNGTRKGVGSFCLAWCEERCRQLRIDTHENNLPMRSMLQKRGYQYCGIIHVEDGTPRHAYCKP